ncbi:MAG TPA: hypothetical protein VGB56_01090 [Flavisolibacter sp.]|jgi:hypothetical protein
MDHNTKDEDQKGSEKKGQERGEVAVQNTSDITKSGGETVVADRDAGSLDHGELGGNFGEDQEEGNPG